MAKGFIKYETSELEYLAIKTARTSGRQPYCYIYIPKKYANRRVIVAVAPEHKSDDEMDKQSPDNIGKKGGDRHE